ncbi:hypothetical protein D3C75_686900 [compost metagenome]
MTLDEQLDAVGLVTISERLKCKGGLDGMARHAGVNTLDDFVKWVEMIRRENMEMIARHDLGIHKLGDDIDDFVYGKSGVLWEVHVNLLHVLKNTRWTNTQGMNNGV